MPYDPSILLRRGVFIGINVCALALIYGLAVQPLLALFGEQADRLAQASVMLSKYRAVAIQEAAVRDAAARADEVTSSAAFLPGGSEGAASAGLQARLKGIAAQAGAHVQSVRALEPVTDGDVHYLRAHLELAGPVAAIYATLRAIEGGELHLLVGQALLRMSPHGGTTPAQEPSIEAQLDVYGPVGRHALGR